METSEHVPISKALGNCEGFEVYGPTARIGTVEDVRRNRKSGDPALLSVRAGLLGVLLVHVPVSEVAEVSLDERRIVLRPGGLLAGPRRPDAGTRAA